MLTSDWSDRDFITVELMARELEFQPRDLMCVMYSESGAHANVKNHGGHHAVGLIQFMEDTLKGLGWHRDWAEFATISVTEQLPYVRRFLAPHRGLIGSVGQLYTAVFLPGMLRHAIDPEFKLVVSDRSKWDRMVFAANSAFDANGDLCITVDELDKAVWRNCRGARWEELIARLDGREAPAVEDVPLDLRTTIGLQAALSALGYACAMDGIPGAETATAIGAFQKDHPPLVVDRIPGPKTRAALQSALAAVATA